MRNLSKNTYTWWGGFAHATDVLYHLMKTWRIGCFRALVGYLFQDPRTSLQAVRSIALQWLGAECVPWDCFPFNGAVLLKSWPSLNNSILHSQAVCCVCKTVCSLVLCPIYLKGLPGWKHHIGPAESSVVILLQFNCFLLSHYSSLTLSVFFFLPENNSPNLPSCKYLSQTVFYGQSAQEHSTKSGVLGSDFKMGFLGQITCWLVTTRTPSLVVVEWQPLGDANSIIKLTEGEAGWRTFGSACWWCNISSFWDVWGNQSLNQMTGAGEYRLIRKDVERPKCINNQFKAKPGSFFSSIERIVNLLQL